MRAGRLDRLVTIQSNAPTQSATGAALDSWSDLATVWAARLDGKGREFFEAAQVKAEAATIYRIRWRDDVTAGMRILDGAEIWDIQSVALIGGRREALEVVATRLGA